MIDVKNCRCKHPGCTRQPNYGHEGGRAKYCSSHKLAEMVNVVSRRCDFLGCKRQVRPNITRHLEGLLRAVLGMKRSRRRKKYDGSIGGNHCQSVPAAPPQLVISLISFFTVSEYFSCMP